MKSAFLAAVLSILSVASTDAFCASPAARLRTATPARTTSVSMEMSAEPMSRRAVLGQGVVGLAGILALSQQASAGILPGADQKSFPGVLDPRAAVKDASKLGSDSVKQDIDALMKYRSNLKDIASILEKNPQADVLPTIKETFQFAKFRKVLNEVNEVFDEDTQRGTDLIVRNMLQDALELANAAKLKDGIPRSSRKGEILQKKLAKLEQAFQSLTAYL